MPSSYPHLLWRLQAELRRDSLTLQTHPSPSRDVAVSNRYREGCLTPYDSVAVALEAENGWLQERELFVLQGMPRTGTTGVATRLGKPRERQLKHPYPWTPVISESKLA